MVRIYEKAKKDPKELDRYFGVTIGDIYSSDRMADAAGSNPEFKKSLLMSLYDFFHGSYGDISGYDRQTNEEDRNFGMDLFGRYHSGDWFQPANINGTIMRIKRPDLIFRIRTYEGNTYVLGDSEWDWLIREEEKRG